MCKSSSNNVFRYLALTFCSLAVLTRCGWRTQLAPPGRSLGHYLLKAGTRPGSGSRDGMALVVAAVMVDEMACESCAGDGPLGPAHEDIGAVVKAAAAADAAASDTASDTLVS